MERNENSIYKHDMDEKGETNTQSMHKIIIRSMTKQTLKWRFILENKSRHMINKILSMIQNHSSKTVMVHYIGLR